MSHDYYAAAAYQFIITDVGSLARFFATAPRLGLV